MAAIRLLVVLLGVFVSPARAADPLPPWHGLGDHVGEVFWGDPAWLQAAAVASTAVFVFSGADAAVFDAVRDRPDLRAYSRPAVRFGSWAPLWLGGPLKHGPHHRLHDPAQSHHGTRRR